MKRAPSDAPAQLSPHERATLAAIYEETSPRVRRLLRWQGIRRRADQEELIVQIYESIARHPDTYNPGINRWGWVAGFTWRIASNFRRLARHRTEQLTLPDGVDEMSNQNQTPEEHLLQKERQAILQRILDTIPKERRIVLLMKDVEGMQISEIAQALGIPESTARTRLSRARQEFLKAAGRLNKEDRRALGSLAIVAAPFTESDMEAFFADMRDAPVEEVPSGMDDRIWSRLTESLDTDPHTSVAPPTPRTINAGQPARWLARLSNAQAAGLGVGLFLAGATSGAAPFKGCQNTRLPSIEIPVTVASSTRNAAMSAATPSITVTPPITSALAVAEPSTSAASAPKAPKKSAAVPENPEISILNHAGQALASGDAAGALAMTRDLARAFPKGRLMEERDYVAIKALMALGQRDEAARRFERFCSAYPQSLFRDELAQAMSRAPQSVKTPEGSQ